MRRHRSRLRAPRLWKKRAFTPARTQDSHMKTTSIVVLGVPTPEPTVCSRLQGNGLLPVLARSRRSRQNQHYSFNLGRRHSQWQTRWQAMQAEHRVSTALSRSSARSTSLTALSPDPRVHPSRQGFDHLRLHGGICHGVLQDILATSDPHLHHPRQGLHHLLPHQGRFQQCRRCVVVDHRRAQRRNRPRSSSSHSAMAKRARRT